MNKLYEGMFLFDSNLAGRDWPGLERLVEDLLRRNSAELLYSERWPDRKLAYEIRGCKKGTYYLTYFNAPPASISTLQRDVQLSERVLRLLVIQEEGLEVDMERRRRREVTGPPEDLDDRTGRSWSRRSSEPESSDDFEGSPGHRGAGRPSRSGAGRDRDEVESEG